MQQPTTPAPRTALRACRRAEKPPTLRVHPVAQCATSARAQARPDARSGQLCDCSILPRRAIRFAGNVDPAEPREATWQCGVVALVEAAPARLVDISGSRVLEIPRVVSVRR